MGQVRLFGRYRLLQSYVGWTDEDEDRIRLIAPLLRRHLPGLIDDFYDAIQQHPQVRSVITGGEAQIERLKGSLLGWVNDLLSALYDEEYVGRSWRVGRRHVEIGLDHDLAIIEDAYQDEASAKLQRTERLATMGQIAGGIAHELRNPLNVMKT